MSQNKVDIQGHRGCRGLLPENTIPAFLHAVKLGVNTLELDVVVTKDKQILVSHEPYMSAQICLYADGIEIDAKNEKKLNVFEMTTAEVQAFDCGSKYHPNFPNQVKMKVSKPLLSEVIDAVEDYVLVNNLPPVNYNIEIKSTVTGTNIYHPEPTEFANLLLEVLQSKKILDRCVIQSFDVRSVQAVKKLSPKVTTSFLVANIKGVSKNLKLLGFNPDYYSPQYKLVTQRTVNKLHQQGIKIAVWTVNEKADIEKMKAMGVDAIITDYPDRALE
jgi:glycerophosphoryl diester phosphodiesterase